MSITAWDHRLGMRLRSGRKSESRNVRLKDIRLLEEVPPRSILNNSGGKLSGVTVQNERQGDRVLVSFEVFDLSVEDTTDVRFVR